MVNLILVNHLGRRCADGGVLMVRWCVGVYIAKHISSLRLKQLPLRFVLRHRESSQSNKWDPPSCEKGSRSSYKSEGSFTGCGFRRTELQ
jgi:hypothetical protein